MDHGWFTAFKISWNTKTILFAKFPQESVHWTSLSIYTERKKALDADAEDALKVKAEADDDDQRPETNDGLFFSSRPFFRSEREQEDIFMEANS